MTKMRSLPSGSARCEGPAAPARAAVTKRSVSLRIDVDTRQLIDRAAAVLGKTRTEFMVESARVQAVDVLLDQRLFRLAPDHFDAFVQALDSPPEPSPKLKALLDRTPLWKQ